MEFAKLAEPQSEMGGADTAKDLAAGGAGGIAQVLIGQYEAFTDL